jgi:hypothetical protein
MTTQTKERLIKSLERIKELCLRLPYPYAGEIVDDCNDLINSLNNDETITESK